MTELPVAADPAAVVKLCAAAGEPGLAKALIEARLPLDKVQQRLEGAGAIRVAVAAAGRISPTTIDPRLADGFIAQGASPEHVSGQLFIALRAAEGPEISNVHTNRDPAEARRAGNFGWDRIVAEVNARYEAGRGD